MYEVMDVFEDPRAILKEVEKWDDDQTTASKMFKIMSFVNMCYCEPCLIVFKNLDKVAVKVSQLCELRKTIKKPSAKSLLVSSGDLHVVNPVVSAIKKIVKDDCR